MKLGITSDHRGFKLKINLFKKLEEEYQIIDFGTFSEESVDYPDYAFKLCQGILSGEIEKGILICGTGIGMSIAANKVKGIMCAKVDCAEEARLAVEHNHANVISFTSEFFMSEMKEIVNAYLKAKPLEDERYLRRIEEIKKIEKKKSYK
mgnify:CR=1 FL=1